MRRIFIQESITVAAATFLSRIFGFVRDIVIARFFGTGIPAQAFVAAYKLPNMLRNLVAEGAVQAAFIPVFSRYAQDKSSLDEFWRLANIVLSILLAVLSACVVAGIIFAPILARLIAPGFIADPDQMRLTIHLTRWLFPYILIISIAAFFGSLLNTLKSFAPPSLGPLAQNLAFIVITTALYKKFGADALVFGILLGGVLQIVIQIPALIRRGARLRLRRDWRDSAVKQIGILMIPRVLSAGVYQLSTLVDTILASLAFIVGAGGVAALYYGNRIVQLPLGIFGFALNTVALPTLSRFFAEGDQDQFARTAAFALKLILFFLIPASAGLIILARPIVSILFERGLFDAYSTRITSDAVAFYAVGLFAFGGSKILSSCFFAMNDTRTPFKVAAFTITINIILNIILMFPMKLSGIALATSISNGVNFFVLLFLITKRITFNMTPFIVYFLKVLFATFGMAAMIAWLSARWLGDIPGKDLGESCAGLFGTISLGALIYFLLAHLVCHKEAGAIMSRVIKGRE